MRIGSAFRRRWMLTGSRRIGSGGDQWGGPREEGSGKRAQGRGHREECPGSSGRRVTLSLPADRNLVSADAGSIPAVQVAALEGPRASRPHWRDASLYVADRKGHGLQSAGGPKPRGGGCGHKSAVRECGKAACANCLRPRANACSAAKEWRPLRAGLGAVVAERRRFRRPVARGRRLPGSH